MGTITTAEVLAGLHYAEQFRWPGSTLTYSIPNPGTSFWSPSSYEAGSEPFDAAFGVLNTVQRAAFVSALDAWDRLIALNFIEVGDSSLSQGQIRVAFTDTIRQLGDDAAAYAYTPPPPGGGISPLNGDIWIDDEYKPDDAEVGSFVYGTMLHELGHALGLKHPFEGARLPTEFDTTRYTVMSYEDLADGELRFFTRDGNTLFADTILVQPSTPMVLDIIAIQALYGAGGGAATGANTYTFDQDSALLATIHDDGGSDTFDLSSHVRASSVNLTPGAYSSIALYSVAAQTAFWTAAFPGFASFISQFMSAPGAYVWVDNVATSMTTVIENVLAGSADDTITGNAANNSLSGGAGSDSIAGGTGGDTINGGAAGAAGNYLRGDDGADSLIGGANFDDINGNMGSDTVATGAGEDYCVGGRDNDSLSGGADYDLVYGNLGDDTCVGDGGNDVVRGGQGNDTLSGGDGNDFVSGDRGDDTMIGGAGADLFHSSGDAGIDRVLDFSLSEGDRVLLDAGTTFTVAQVGGDTVIQMNAGQVILVGVSMSSLPPGTIFGF